MLTLFYHHLYTDGIDPEARFPRDRYRLLAEQLRPVEGISLREPRQASIEELCRAHDSGYVARFLSGRLTEKEVRTIGLKPWREAIVPRTLHLTGGSLEALELVLKQGGISGNMAGGTHHAFRDCGSGYCIFNDLAICALTALDTPGVERVLILDLDVHQGDGTAEILANYPQLVTCSIHGAKNFPFRKKQSDLDIGLPCEADDQTYLDALEQAMEHFPFNQFDLILYQAGVDALEHDRLGRLKVTQEGMDRRNHRVFSAAQDAGVPLVVLMGGGYSEPIHHTVEAFTRLFSTAAQYANY